MVKNDQVTLVLNGTVPVTKFGAGIENLAALMQALNKEIAPSENVTWVVDELEQRKSARTTLLGVSRNGAVPRIVEGYERVGQSLERKSSDPFSSRVMGPARRIADLIGTDVISVKFETGNCDAVITAPMTTAEASATRAIRPSFGAVKGNIETVSRHNQLHFTLYDVATDDAVSCCMGEGDENKLRRLWGKCVIVEGMIKRDPATGNPTSIRCISEIMSVGDTPVNAYLKARGTSKRPLRKGHWITAEEAIRRVRNG